MRGLSALVVLLCAIATVSARRDLFSVCPSSLPFPRNEDVVRRSPSPAAGCVEVQVPDQFISFFVEAPESLAIPALKDLVQVIPLPAFPSYYVVLAHESALLDLDMALLGTSKQIISAPKRRTPKRSPAEIPAFQKLAVKDDIINSLDGKVYYADLELLTGEKSFTLDGRQVTLKTRYTHTQSNLDAGTFIYQTFQSLGLTALYQPFRYSGRETRNIIGIKQGTTLANEVVVVGAHMDSISPDPNNLAPGCIDNGSGAEAVILMAKAFANYTSKRTIHFVLFGAEEQGLIGSNYYVDTLGETGYNVKYSLVMDMIGYSNNYFGVKLETSSSSANRNLADLMQDNTEAYGNGLTIARSTNYFGSDHVPFIDSGIPCFLAIEQDDTSYVGYHRTTDRINYLNVDQSIGITRGMAGTLYDLAF